MRLGDSIRLSNIWLISRRKPNLPSTIISGWGRVPIFYHHQINITPSIALFLSFNRLLNLLSSYYKLTIKLRARFFRLQSLIFLLRLFSLFMRFPFLHKSPYSFLILNFLSSFNLFSLLTNLIKLFLMPFSHRVSIFLRLLIARMLNLSQGIEHYSTISFSRKIQ